VRVLWYNWRDILNPEAGGAEVFTHEVCRRLVKRDDIDSVTIFASSFPEGKNSEYVDNVRIVRKGNKYSVYKAAREFYKENHGAFDIVVDEINTKPFDTPSFVHGKPIVALIHQLAREFWFYETSFPINILGYLFLERHWLRKYRQVPTITVSKSTQEDLQTWGFRNVSVVPEGIGFRPLEKPVEKEATPTFLFVGRLKSAKKPDDALRAFEVIKKDMKDARLWIVGDGYMMEKLKRMASEMSSKSPGVRLFGKVSNSEKLELMSKAHVLLAPGVREGWGLVVTEANAMGTPAIAYDIPGLRDSVIDGVTGKLVPRGDTVAMAIEAMELFKNQEILHAYSSKALDISRNFDWDHTASHIADVLNHALNPKASRSEPTPAAGSLA
jgi:glycosyltransferase involved in cell wall biosynthesis